ncbi:MAG: NAD(P)/FAD-dependent oxidoreductase, partial [Clostridia bacterium]|nr:NAD(P)/FAD-dependent oxidoreductase [Clostridia bacterium]
MNKTKLLLERIRVSVDASDETIANKAREKMKRAGINPSTLHFRLYKKSIDARNREDIRFECAVLAEGELPKRALEADFLSRMQARIITEEEPNLTFGSQSIAAPPVVVGMGPAGLFAALLLAQNGYAPILIDRGGSIAERAADVTRFRNEGVLNTECNVQFGAGGAGTFSDGKLITRINDPLCNYVLRSLITFGAPEDIAVKAKPHIGTDILRVVVDNILTEIERLGGRVLYHCRMDAILENADKTLTVKTTKGDFVAGSLLLAPGHSARDTYRYLIKQNYAIEAKP